MTDVNTSYKNAVNRNGLPEFEVMDNYIDANLVAGAEPAMGPTSRFLLDDSLTLSALTVVGLTSSGKLTKAVYNATVASGVKPIGVLRHAATSGASNSTIFGEVFLTGCFNVGSDDTGTDSPLVWDSSFDTAAKKTTWPGLPQYQGNPNLIFRKRSITA